MARTLDSENRSRVVRYLLLGWKPRAIAQELSCHVSSVYRIKHNLLHHQAARAPPKGKIGRPRDVPPEAVEKLLQWLSAEPWRSHREIQTFLKKDFGVSVSQATVSRVLKTHNFKGKKKAPRGSNKPNAEPKAAEQTVAQVLSSNGLQPVPS